MEKGRFLFELFGPNPDGVILALFAGLVFAVLAYQVGYFKGYAGGVGKGLEDGEASGKAQEYNRIINMHFADIVQMSDEQRSLMAPHYDKGVEDGVTTAMARAWTQVVATGDNVKVFINGKLARTGPGGSAPAGVKGIGFWYLDGHYRNAFISDGILSEERVEAMYGKEHGKILVQTGIREPKPPGWSVRP